MYRVCLLPAFLVCLLIAGGAAADPIHPSADGGYWHHESGWVFPARVAGFERVGIPQDIEGSRDAAAWYARVVGATRIKASVDVYPLESSRAEAMRDRSETSSPAESTLPIGEGLMAARTIWTNAESTGGIVVTYRVERGGWQVRIRIDAPGVDAGFAAELDEFVRAQLWGKLGSA